MTQFAKATVYGTSGSIAITGVVLNGDRIMQGTSFAPAFDVQYLLTHDNEIAGHVDTKSRKEVTVEFIPVGASGNNTKAVAASMVYLPVSASVVTLSNMTTASYDGAYCYLGNGSVRTTNDGFCVVTMPLVMYDNITAATMATLIV